MGIPEAAARAKVPERTMRDRMIRINQSIVDSGGDPVLIREGRRGPWKILVMALKRATGGEVSEPLEDVIARLETLDTRLTALRNTVAAEKRRQAMRWEIQDRINRRTVAQVADVGKLAAT